MTLVKIINCRWCDKKVIPDLETGKYPKHCPNKNCRRQTWNKSNEEIKDNQNKKIQALFKNHKDGIVRSKKKYAQSSLNFLNLEKKKQPKQVMCMKCELFFENDSLLNKHKIRRGH